MSEEPTKAELYTEAQALEVEGRSTMDKDELAAAIAAARVADPDVDAAVAEFENERDELDGVNDLEATPSPKVVEAAPVISQEPTTQGELTFLTDRAQ